VRLLKVADGLSVALADHVNTFVLCPTWMRLVGVCLAGLALSAAGADLPLGLPPLPEFPDNPSSAAKIALGRKLFEDPRLSSTGLVSCASCHDEKKSFTDAPLETSRGIHGFVGTRNAPSLLNVAWNASLYWDGRAGSLEEQAEHPFTSPVQMGLLNCEPLLQLVRTDATYRVRYEDAFSRNADRVTLPELLQTIAVFERTLLAGNSPFDRYWFTGDELALSLPQLRGLNLFREKAHCASCHLIGPTSALFTDNRFHNLGVGRADPLALRAFLAKKLPAMQVAERVQVDPATSDLGRGVVTRAPLDAGAFRTPSLRNVGRTAPYMHDGSLKTLDEVVTWHVNGGALSSGKPANPLVSRGLRVALSSSERADLVAFLEALTSPPFVRGSGR
jgi:cytochrome c peroxidase